MPPIHHIVAGAGAPPLVFVHGLCCSHADWRAQIEHFCARHMTIAVDLPGHGATPAADAATIERCGAEVAALLNARAVPSAVLVGHSLGCRVVLEAVPRAPSRVAGIVLVDGSRFRPAMTQIFEAAFAAGGYKPLLRGLFQQMFTPRSDAGTAAAAIERALAVPEDVGRGLLLSLVRYDVDKLEAALENTNKPLLVLQTTFVNDKRERASMRAGQTTPYLDYIRAKVPAACIEVLPGLGHFPQLDAPAETNRAIERFIASLEVSDPPGLTP
jgi:pimeloyl-ACP methyl ester carboxylesterase